MSAETSASGYTGEGLRLRRQWAASARVYATRFLNVNPNGLVILALRVVGVAAAFLLHVLLARAMRVQDYGIYASVWTWVIVLGTLAPFGLSMVATRFVATYAELGIKPLLHGFLRASSLFVIFLSAMLAVVFFIFLRSKEPHISSLDAVAALSAAACLPFVALTELGKGVARGAGRAVLAYGPGYVLRPALLMAATLCLMLTGAVVDPGTILLASLGAACATACLQWSFVRNGFRHLRGVPRQRDLSGWLRAAAPLSFVEGQTLFMAYTDVIILQFFVPPEEVALYFVAAKVATLASFIHVAVASSAGQPLAATHAAGRMGEIESLSRKFIRQASYPTIAIAVVLALGGAWILRLFGTDYVAGWSILQVLVLGLVLQAAMGPLKFTLPMTGAHKAAGLFAVSSMILNLALNLTLIPLWGPLGAAAATTATIAITGAAMVLAVRRRLGFWSVIGA